MAIAFQLTPERIEELRLYHEIGWPPSLTMNQLELYERTTISMKSKFTQSYSASLDCKLTNSWIS
ncbi:MULTISPECIES: hypothetical protein [Leuconostoc gelidum group]|uniref:hypothetical protein n=1 Tax=Leuconostoc gelidum group TaxID=3016637 RepID=UPI00027E6C5B|nr:MULTISPECIES: hypothetical protein [Leuconostoc gelidum group]AFS40254.1 hypothetical protein C269_04055 [Leuconostoc gelidum JB7]MBZ5948033.1 hypothetical protein [Leuconostoc gasicomitatum]MBZ5988176.1 hypothetical protein [Leuconostoc gasicomitatum]MBZ5990157.1 hypothetical protein [Leuconostoc gasicomitatum]